jgi:hypothetical protein
MSAACPDQSVIRAASSSSGEGLEKACMDGREGIVSMMESPVPASHRVDFPQWILVGMDNFIFRIGERA